jgi:hypothetical protein
MRGSIKADLRQAIDCSSHRTAAALIRAEG